jgi:hypothetical protein
MVFLGEDIPTVHPETIINISINITVVGGKIVSRARKLSKRFISRWISDSRMINPVPCVQT